MGPNAMCRMRGAMADFESKAENIYSRQIFRIQAGHLAVDSGIQNQGRLMQINAAPLLACELRSWVDNRSWRGRYFVPPARPE